MHSRNRTTNILRNVVIIIQHDDNSSSNSNSTQNNCDTMASNMNYTRKHLLRQTRVGSKRVLKALIEYRPIMLSLNTMAIGFAQVILGKQFENFVVRIKIYFLIYSRICELLIMVHLFIYFVSTSAAIYYHTRYSSICVHMDNIPYNNNFYYVRVYILAKMCVCCMFVFFIYIYFHTRWLKINVILIRESKETNPIGYLQMFIARCKAGIQQIATIVLPVDACTSCVLFPRFLIELCNICVDLNGKRCSVTIFHMQLLKHRFFVKFSSLET